MKGKGRRRESEMEWGRERNEKEWKKEKQGRKKLTVAEYILQRQTTQSFYRYSRVSVSLDLLKKGVSSITLNRREIIVFCLVFKNACYEAVGKLRFFPYFFWKRTELHVTILNRKP